MGQQKLSPLCRLCAKKIKSEDELVLGRKPLCNYFSSIKLNKVDLYNLAIGQCLSCGLVQLTQHPQAIAITPRHSWLRYNEPESHLDEVGDYLNLAFAVGGPEVLALGPFEQPLIKLLGSQFQKKEVDINKYISVVEDRFPYLEAYQSLCAKETVELIKDELGLSDLVICRYLLEHSNQPVQFLQSLGQLLKTDGMLYIEIPDSRKFLESCDYSFIWEEHLSYFTDETFRYLAEISGYEIVRSMKFSGALEDALVYILKPRLGSYKVDSSCLQSQCNVFRRYIDNFSIIQKKYHEEFENLVSSGKKLALFGAGHQAIMFINLFQVDRYLSCIIDDDCNKVGTFLPGTNLEIISSSEAFRDKLFSTFLLAISPNIEEKIVHKIQESYRQDCSYYSIFQKSELGTLISQ